jgi:hypothetical protein
MKLSDLNFKTSGNAKFRTAYRITLQVKPGYTGYINSDTWKLGFNKESKALEALEFLENLVETDENFLSVEMVHVPRVKGSISYSQAKKRGRVYGVNGAAPDLCKLLNSIFEV